MDLMTVVQLLSATGVSAALIKAIDYWIKRKETRAPETMRSIENQELAKAIISISQAKDSLEKDIARIRTDRKESEDRWLAIQDAAYRRERTLLEEIERLRLHNQELLRSLDRLEAVVRRTCPDAKIPPRSAAEFDWYGPSKRSVDRC